MYEIIKYSKGNIYNGFGGNNMIKIKVWNFFEIRWKRFCWFLFIYGKVGIVYVLFVKLEIIKFIISIDEIVRIYLI